ncbi:hypothetical protein P3S67_007905 [Capsicum chacoense]
MHIQVQILSKSLIKPSSPTPGHLRNYKLSFFDQVTDLAHMPLVLLYPHCNNHTKHEELEESLSRILSHVYPLAATVNCKLDDFLQQENKDLDLALSFWPHGIMDVDDTNILDTPLMVVQVTNSECGVCKFGTPSKEIDFMSFNLGTLFPTKDLTAIHEPPIDEGKRTKSKLIARKFVFDEAAISRLREKFDSSDVLNFKPSQVEMITTLLWRSLIRATRNPDSKWSIVSFPLNLRGKVAAFPETTNSLGNFIIDQVPIKVEHDEINLELHHIGKFRRDSIKETTSYCAKLLKMR